VEPPLDQGAPLAALFVSGVVQDSDEVVIRNWAGNAHCPGALKQERRGTWIVPDLAGDLRHPALPRRALTAAR
jgi:hypothetical protein